MSVIQSFLFLALSRCSPRKKQAPSLPFFIWRGFAIHTRQHPGLSVTTLQKICVVVLSFWRASPSSDHDRYVIVSTVFRTVLTAQIGKRTTRRERIFVSIPVAGWLDGCLLDPASTAACLTFLGRQCCHTANGYSGSCWSHNQREDDDDDDDDDDETATAATTASTSPLVSLDTMATNGNIPTQYNGERQYLNPVMTVAAATAGAQFVNQAANKIHRDRTEGPLTYRSRLDCDQRH